MYIFCDKKIKKMLITIWKFGKRLAIKWQKKLKKKKKKKKINTKESFQCFYIPVILIDSVYRKDENYYPQVFLEKFINSFLRRSIRIFGFWGFWSSSWNIRIFLWPRNFCFLKYKKFYWGGIFLVFWSRKVPSSNIRKIWC